LIGLLACTGLRISEALHLKVGDVDWGQSTLIVRQSKYGKSRMVPLHRTAVPPLRAYARRRQNLFPLAEYFFVSERGHRLALSTADHLFISLREGIPCGRRPPRLHDFRHTVACQVLQRWQTDKRGALNRLAILSRFLGHTQVTDTYWYFTLFPQLAAETVRHVGAKSHENR
jgi:integrase